MRSEDPDEAGRPPMLVTASVDQIQLASRLQLSQNLIMRGQVVWTGRSSMDICMQLFQARSSLLYNGLLYMFLSASSSCVMN
jgi:hypothetical protein